jgi:hypothetical protein
VHAEVDDRANDLGEDTGDDQRPSDHRQDAPDSGDEHQRDA